MATQSKRMRLVCAGRVTPKILILFLGITCFVPCAAFAQGGWIRQSIAPEPDIYAVATLYEHNAVALDAQGRVLTTDGHYVDAQASGTTSPIYGLSVVNSSTGTAVGGNGTILRGGGATWVPQSSGTTEALTAVSFVDFWTGTAVGTSGTILRTTDSGTTWTLQDSGTLFDLFGVAFADADNGIAVGDSGTILRTTDGGASWLPQFSGTDSHLQGVSFVDATTAIVVGDFGTILRTSDGGETWLPRSSGTTYNLYGLCTAIEGNRVFAVGALEVGGQDCPHVGIILGSTDRGATWTALSQERCGLYAISFINNIGTAVGEHGIILYTAYGGSQWNDALWGPIPFNLTAVSFVDANTGTAVGWYYSGDSRPPPIIVHTTDGGATWTRQYVAALDPLYGVSFVDAQTGWAVGAFIFHTTDGGATWTPQQVPVGGPFYAVSFVDANTGTAVGYSWPRVLILHTTDGGTTWTWAGSGLDLNISLLGVSFLDANVGTVVGGWGGGGIILHTTDGGASWSYQGFDGYHPRGVSLADVNLGVAVGSDSLGYGVSLRTTDGGATWTRHVLRGERGVLTAVTFVDANAGWAVGAFQDGLGILHSFDGGATWTLQDSPRGAFYAVSFVDANVGTVVGDNGMILRTNTGGE